MVEQMRQAGIVGEAKGAGVASDILIDLAGWEDMKKLMQAKDRSSMLAEYHDEVKKTSTVRTGSQKKRNNRSNGPLFCGLMLRV